MRPVAPWALASSAIAPVALIGGWTVAARHQPSAFSSVHDTISALAARNATDRWIMTTALLVLGSCHLVTALGLRPARRPGRIILGLGGVATLGVATFPLDAHGKSTVHGLVALVAFLSLSLWPALAVIDGHGSALSPRAGRIATAVLMVLIIIFGISLGGDHVGVAERVAAGAQALWPLIVVVNGLWLVRSGRGPNSPRGSIITTDA